LSILHDVAQKSKGLTIQ
jgi:hypothetical protein